MGNKKIQTINKPDRNEYAAEELYKAAELTLQMEKDRYDSLMRGSLTILTCVSILSVVMVALVGLALNGYAVEGKSVAWVVVAFVFVSLPLGASFILAVLMHFRLSYEALPSPTVIIENLKDGDPYGNRFQAAEHLCAALGKCYDSVCLKHNKVLKLFDAAIICLIVAMSLALVSGVVLIIIYFI